MVNEARIFLLTLKAQYKKVSHILIGVTFLFLDSRNSRDE